MVRTSKQLGLYRHTYNPIYTTFLTLKFKLCFMDKTVSTFHHDFSFLHVCKRVVWIKHIACSIRTPLCFFLGPVTLPLTASSMTFCYRIKSALSKT